MALAISIQTFWWLFLSNLFLSFFFSVFLTLFISVLVFVFRPFSFSSGSHVILSYFFNIGNVLLLNMFGLDFFLHASVVRREIDCSLRFFHDGEVPII